MSAETLVLNKAYMEMDLIPWHKAVTLWFKDKAEIVENYEKVIYHNTVTGMKILMPKVIRLVGFDFPPPKNREVPLTKKNLFNRDHGKCGYCKCKLNTKNATVDHIMPRSRGGKHEWMNVVLSCLDCNNVKDDKTPDEAHMPLRTRIYVPELQSNWITGVEVTTNPDGTFAYSW